MKSFLDEARRNPDANPRVSAYQQIIDKGYDGKDYFLTFTNLKKVGINPSSGFDTPNGVYAYPATEILDTVHGDLTNVPFANRAPYIHVLKKKGGGIVDPVESYTNGQLARDIQKIMKIVNKKFPMDHRLERYFLDLIEQSHREAKNNKPITRFWNMTRNFASDPLFAGIMGYGGVKPSSFKDYYEDGKKKKKISTQSKKGVSYSSQGWNNLLRTLGYNGFVDRNGTEVIHMNEPIAAVFLSKKAFSIEEMILNKSYERLVRQEKFHDTIEDLKKRGNTVSITEKIRGETEKAFYQIVDAKIGGCDISLFKGVFYIDGSKFGGEIKAGTFNSPNIEIKGVTITNGNYSSLRQFSDNTFMFGTLADLNIKDCTLLGGEVYDCFFFNTKTASNVTFYRCRNVDSLMLFKCRMIDCHMLECGYSNTIVEGGDITRSTLDSTVKVRGGCRMDQVKINGGRYSKSFIDRSNITGGKFFNCRITDTDVKDGEFNNVTKGDHVYVSGGVWNEDI